MNLLLLDASLPGGLLLVALAVRLSQYVASFFDGAFSMALLAGLKSRFDRFLLHERKRAGRLCHFLIRKVQSHREGNADGIGENKKRKEKML